MRLLDLFCKAGGASMGYARAGFEVVGVDIAKQPRYPFKFIQADALEVLQDTDFLRSFDVLAASPPCQTHSRTKHLRDAQGKSTTKVDLIPQTRAGFLAARKPYVIENVPGAPLQWPVTLCGSMFGLGVRRHRLFEIVIPRGQMTIPWADDYLVRVDVFDVGNAVAVALSCNHKAQGRPIGVYGSMRDNIPNGGKTAESIEQAREAMGIDWMIWSELVEAIPPAYTEFIGEQLMAHIQAKEPTHD